MNSYKKWSEKEREKSLRLTNKAKKLGLIPEPTKCRICGRTESLQLHNEDYDVTLSIVPRIINGTATEEEKKQVDSVLIPICRSCHMKIHAKRKEE